MKLCSSEANVLHYSISSVQFKPFLIISSLQCRLVTNCSNKADIMLAKFKAALLQLHSKTQ